MIRWIAAIAAAALLAVPGMAQQGQTPTPIPVPADVPDVPGEGEPFEPLLMLDEDGRLVLVSDLGETELDVVQQLQRGEWRAKLSRKIEMLIRVDTSSPEGRRALLKWTPELLGEPTSSKAGSRARTARRSRWSRHHRRQRAKRCHTVLQRLGLSGEELKAVRPLLEQVQEARRALAIGDWRARRSLRSPQADAEAKALLTTFRTGKAAREARLASARKRLQEVVTIKQEALLVVQGILE